MNEYKCYIKGCGNEPIAVFHAADAQAEKGSEQDIYRLSCYEHQLAVIEGIKQDYRTDLIAIADVTDFFTEKTTSDTTLDK